MDFSIDVPTCVFNHAYRGALFLALHPLPPPPPPIRHSFILFPSPSHSFSRSLARCVFVPPFIYYLHTPCYRNMSWNKRVHALHSYIIIIQMCAHSPLFFCGQFRCFRMKCGCMGDKFIYTKLLRNCRMSKILCNWLGTNAPNTVSTAWKSSFALVSNDPTYVVP